MRGLTGRQILSIWETGLHAPGTERALTILAADAPDRSFDELSSVPVGQRDAWLLAIHQDTFGHDLDALVSCPNCGQRLEFKLPLDNLAGMSDAPVETTGRVETDCLIVEYRLPDSRDLTAIAHLADVHAARSVLVSRCVLSTATTDGNEVEASEALSGAVLAEVCADMARRQPSADISVDLTCPTCDRHWQSPLDPARFLWAEIAAEALRLLREVHVLARAYSWSEADILAMSSARRQRYLEMVQ